MVLGLDTKPAAKKAATPTSYEEEVEVPDESTVLDYDCKAKDTKAPATAAG